MPHRTGILVAFAVMLPLLVAPPAVSADRAAQDDPFGFLTSAERVHQSQVFVQSDGSLLMVWVQKDPFDFDLFVARPSTGSWRLLWSTDASVDPAELLSDRDELVLTHSPRIVGGREARVLVGANPHGLIMTWDASAWKIVRDDLPPWVSSAAVSDGRLVLIGNEDGQLRAAIEPL